MHLFLNALKQETLVGVFPTDVNNLQSFRCLLVTIEAPMCVHSTIMRQTKDKSQRLIVHLFNDLSTTASHALPNDDVPLREETVPIHNIRINFRSDYRLGRIYQQPEGRELASQKTDAGISVIVPQLEIHSMVVAELD